MTQPQVNTLHDGRRPQPRALYITASSSPAGLYCPLGPGECGAARAILSLLKLKDVHPNKMVMASLQARMILTPSMKAGVCLAAFCDLARLPFFALPPAESLRILMGPDASHTQNSTAAVSA